MGVSFYHGLTGEPFTPGGPLCGAWQLSHACRNVTSCQGESRRY